jgi:hypothetical protein
MVSPWTVSCGLPAFPDRSSALVATATGAKLLAAPIAVFDNVPLSSTSKTLRRKRTRAPAALIARPNEIAALEQAQAGFAIPETASELNEIIKYVRASGANDLAYSGGSKVGTWEVEE